MPINGQVFDWESMSVTISGKVLEGITEISYSDEKDKEPVYGKGSVPIGYGSGKYKANGKLTLLKEEYDILAALALPVGGIFRLPPFPITVSYKNDDCPMTTDVLPDCTFTKRDRKGKTGDKELSVELEFLILSEIIEA